MVASKPRGVAARSAAGVLVVTAGLVGLMTTGGCGDGGGDDGGTNRTTSTVVAPRQTALDIAGVPPGFELTSDGRILVLSNATDEPSGGGAGSPEAPGVGSGLTEVRAAGVVSSVVGGDRLTVALTFECVRTSADRINSVRYRVDGATLAVEANIIGGYVGADCTGGPGASIVVPVDVALPPDVEVLAGLVR